MAGIVLYTRNLNNSKLIFHAHFTEEIGLFCLVFLFLENEKHAILGPFLADFVPLPPPSHSVLRANK